MQDAKKIQTSSLYNLMIKISIELKTAKKSFQSMIVLSDIIMPLSQSETYAKAESSGPEK